LVHADVAEIIAKEARENLGGNEVISVGAVFAEQVLAQTCCAVIAILPNDGSKELLSVTNVVNRQWS
jgi:hypothetical protein